MKPPDAVTTLNRIPNSDYNFTHTVVQESSVPASIIIWNLIDFGHVNWVHRKLYHHCKTLAESGTIHLLEYGVNQFFFLNSHIAFRYLMWHEFIPPHTVRHLSISPWGSYTKTEITMEEFIREGKKHTRVYHNFYMRLPRMLMPFKNWVTKYIEAWSAILWEEDSGMLLRRQRVLEAGFRDHPLDTEVKGVEGFAIQNHTPVCQHSVKILHATR